MEIELNFVGLNTSMRWVPLGMIAKLLGYCRYIQQTNGGYKQTNITGGAHLVCTFVYRNTYLDKSESYYKSRLLTTKSTVHIYIYIMLYIYIYGHIYIYTQTYVSFISQVWFMLHLRETPCDLYHRMSWGIIAISLGYILQVLRC